MKVENDVHVGKHGSNYDEMYGPEPEPIRHMTLTLEQEEKLNFIFEELEENRKRLSEWETGFLNDQIKRYEEHQAKMSLSPKQWTVLDRMYQKVTGG